MLLSEESDSGVGGSLNRKSAVETLGIGGAGLPTGLATGTSGSVGLPNGSSGVALKSRSLGDVRSTVSIAKFNSD